MDEHGITRQRPHDTRRRPQTLSVSEGAAGRGSGPPAPRAAMRRRRRTPGSRWIMSRSVGLGLMLAFAFAGTAHAQAPPAGAGRIIGSGVVDRQGGGEVGPLVTPAALRLRRPALRLRAQAFRDQ